MKKFALIILVLILFSALYWIMSREDVETTENVKIEKMVAKKIIPIENKSINEVVHKIRKKNKLPKRVDKNIKDTHPAAKEMFKLKEEKLIQGRVEDGKVIAYGDVVLGMIDENQSDNKTFANFNAQPIKLWDTNKIYYQIEDGLKNKAAVEKAIKILNETSAVEFLNFTEEGQDGIFFKSGKKNCYSLLGKLGGAQPIWLAPDCGVTEILHEVLHALGFIHEQSRADRDIYLSINWDNILPDFYSQYQMVPDDYMATVEGTEFDFRSIMIYRPTFFAKDKQYPTMTPLGGDQINPMKGALSPMDIERIYRIYGD